MSMLNPDDFAPALRIHGFIHGNKRPELLMVLTDRVKEFLDDPDAIRRGYNKDTGHTKMQVPFQFNASPVATFDFLVGILNRSGHMAHWKEVQEIVGKQMFTQGNIYETRRYIYFAIPT